MNYIGSKHTLLPFLEGYSRQIIEPVFRQIEAGHQKIFCDIFAGTGAVGRRFKEFGFQIIANDIQAYAYVLNKAYLEINHTPRFDRLKKAYNKEIVAHRSDSKNSISAVLAFVNSLPGISGFITQNYSPVGERLYYTEENAQKGDAIRQALMEWVTAGLINENEYFYLLCSLLEAIDQVANTASVYGAYLKIFKETAKKPLQLHPLKLTNHVRGCQAYQGDANELIKRIKCDVLYLDPPYNHRQYGANYHVLETIAEYDNPKLRGVTGMRDYLKSPYCQKKFAKKALEELVRQANTKHIFVSYNDEGVLSLEDIHNILSLRGSPKSVPISYNRFKADSSREYTRNFTTEFIHYVHVIN